MPDQSPKGCSQAAPQVVVYCMNESCEDLVNSLPREHRLVCLCRCASEAHAGQNQRRRP